MLKNNKVFLIDDNEIENLMNVKTMEKTLFAQNVKTFENAEYALDVIKQLSISNPEKLPDMIFLDINMPIMNSWDFLDRIVTFSGSILENCKIYILTSSIDENDVAHSKKYEIVSDFIPKPLTVERLQAISIEPHPTKKKN